MILIAVAVILLVAALLFGLNRVTKRKPDEEPMPLKQWIAGWIAVITLFGVALYD